MTGRPGRRHRGSVRVRAVGALALAGALVGLPLAAVTPPATAVTPDESAAAGYVPDPAPRNARITIDTVTPEVLGSGGGGGSDSGVPTVTVSGTVSNVGDQPIAGVDVRLQRGPRLADSDAMRRALTWSEQSFPVVGEFERVTSSLAPGASARFRVAMPARPVPGRAGTDLQLTENGVYPLLVNVNGSPGGAGPARLDDARTLLPVDDVPRPAAATPGGDEAGQGSGTDSASDPRPDDTATGQGATPRRETDPATGFTMVLPLATAPTRVAEVPGSSGADPRVTLTDDTLPDELAGGGRLSGLLDAAEASFTGTGGEAMRRATCLGVDPELLSTVSDIAGGEAVALQSGGETPDSLRDDAHTWLDRLTGLARDTCVVTLPAAQADLDAVARAGDAELARTALDLPRAETGTETGADAPDTTVQSVLGVRPLPSVVVAPGGTMAPGTPAALGLHDATLVVADTSTRTDTGVVPESGPVALEGSNNLRATVFDSAVGSALAATGDAPENPRHSEPGSRYWLGADGPAARLQDARATLLAPSLETRPGGPGVLAVPPAVWGVDGASATSLLRTMADRLASGRMHAVPLAERVSERTTVEHGSLADDPTGAADPGAIGEADVDALRAPLRGIDALRALVDTSDPRGQGAGRFLDPMTGDALRALSVTGRRSGGDGVSADGETGAAARERTARRITGLQTTVRTSVGKVDLLPPGSVFTMAGPTSPLMLVARNGLPFPVRVAVDVSAPEGLRVDPVGVVQVPASGSRTLQLPTDSERDTDARRVVTLTLRVPDGRALSEPVALSVQSGGYPVAVIFTVAAAALALVLAGRRYLRYRRGTPDPADDGHLPGREGDRT